MAGQITGRIAVLAVAAAGLAVPAHAILIVADSELGANSIVRDTAAGREWIRYNYGVGNIDDILPRIALGGDLETWRHATEAEVVGLWANAGVPQTSASADFSYTFNPATAQKAAELILKIGITPNSGGSFDFTTGYIADPGNAGGPWAGAQIAAVFGDSEFDEYHAVTGFTLSRVISQGDQYHNWLVRDLPVPGPGALGLLGLGVMAMAARRRRGAR